LLPYLRVLFAKAATLSCPNCETKVQSHHPDSVTRWCEALPANTRYMVTFDLSSEHASLAERLLVARRSGFGRVIVANQILNLADASLTVPPAASDDAKISVVVDRLTGESDIARVRDSVATAFQYGHGTCRILRVANDDTSAATKTKPTNAQSIDGRQWQGDSFDRQPTCSRCGQEFAEPSIGLFDRNRPIGRCETCDGEGTIDQEPCSACRATGRSKQALGFCVGGQDLGQLCEMEIGSLAQFFSELIKQRGENCADDDGSPEPSSAQGSILTSLLQPIAERLRFLCEVGVDYLSLNRLTRTLSSGERQRIMLTSILGSTLVNMLYVLDEPTRGLHSHDLPSLVAAIGRLHQRGNTVVALDHHAEMITTAQRVVEVGPGAGVEGGQLVFDGTVDGLVEPDASDTGDFVAGRRGRVYDPERRSPRGRLKLTGASGRNLKNVTVQFPLNCLCVVSGVSGSGKTSLVQDTLHGALCDRKQRPVEGALPYDAVFGDSSIDEVVLVDQSPIGRTARSNPVTYIGAFDDIRRVFAETVDAKTRNIKVGKFSFNVAGGRCDKCQGDGQLTVDMKFMTDVHIRCDQCRGTRYRDEVLAVRHRGKNIADVLAMTAKEAFPFFRGQPKVQYQLKALIDVGLGYLQLGQPATMLSSGEAQRLKLAKYLTGAKSKRALFLMDEPTTGLHMSDVVRLADCFAMLVSVGHSLIVVEHNLQLMQYADWIIDLGPGASAAGGHVVAEGTPEQIAASEHSVTGRYLKERLMA
jgi:excinuclease ABC subunit A